MRKLNGTDVFAFARLIRASGMREEIKRCIDEVAKKGPEAINIEDVGIDTILAVMEGLAEHKAEQAIWQALAGPLEMTPAEASTLELHELFEALKTIAEENDLRNFFKYVSGILSKK